MVIAGGGVAALETVLAIRALAGHAVDITMLAPAREFVYRPVTVAEAFDVAEARTYDVAEILADQGRREVLRDDPERGAPAPHRRRLTDAGKAVIVISSEMPELLGVCDRICVMNAGVFVGEFERAAASQEKIMRAIMRKGERLVDRDLERKLEEESPGAAQP